MHDRDFVTRVLEIKEHIYVIVNMGNFLKFANEKNEHLDIQRVEYLLFPTLPSLKIPSV